MIRTRLESATFELAKLQARPHTPIAQRVQYSPDEFSTNLYQNSSTPMMSSTPPFAKQNVPSIPLSSKTSNHAESPVDIVKRLLRRSFSYVKTPTPSPDRLKPESPRTPKSTRDEPPWTSVITNAPKRSTRFSYPNKSIRSGQINVSKNLFPDLLATLSDPDDCSFSGDSSSNSDFGSYMSPRYLPQANVFESDTSIKSVTLHRHISQLSPRNILNEHNQSFT